MIKIALILSVLMQFGAAILAIGLIRRTKYNISWILISLAFVFMAFRRVYELYEAFFRPDIPHFPPLSSWIAVVISCLIFAGTIFIRRIFNVQHELEKLKQEQEARVLNAVIQTEEREKQNFARNLHDGLGPVLSSVKMLLSSLSKEEMSQHTAQVVAKSQAGMDEAVKSIRELSQRMSPHLLESYGIERALDVLIRQLSPSPAINIQFDSQLQEDRLDNRIETAVYRIVSELLTNSIKHAQCSEISLSLFTDEQSCCLLYSDNGKGYDTHRPHNGMGLGNIESRIKAFSGELVIHSKPGKGFYADIKIPTV